MIKKTFNVILLFFIFILLQLNFNCTIPIKPEDPEEKKLTNNKVSAPVFNPVQGSYSSDLSITLSSDTQDALIYYTTDGITEPSASSILYDGPIAISGNGTSVIIKAIAVKNEMEDSDIITNEYHINYNKVSTPEFDPAPGNYDPSQNITISCFTEGAAIYYTTDGVTEPTISSNEYTEPISLSGFDDEVIIKAIAVKNEMENSDVVTAEYKTDWIVNFADPNLEAAVRDVISKPLGDIFFSEVRYISSLSCIRSNVSDLSGIENLVSLKKLYASINNIDDLSPLAGLKSLTVILLSDNLITDISPLAGLTSIYYLDLKKNNITDISPLINLTLLSHLYLGDNSINNINSLSGLSLLKRLDLNNNNIDDISSLSDLINLEFLYLRNNSISDIDIISGLTALTRLNLSYNLINDITPLSGLTLLNELELFGNQISNLSPLTNLTSLSRLYLCYNSVSDISPISDLTSLTILTISNNSISNINSLSGLTSLIRLDINNNNITDINSLSGMTSLISLYSSDNNIQDINVLSGLNSLQNLTLSNNNINNISSLSGLTNLSRLSLSNNEIRDILSLVNNAGLDDGDRLWLLDTPLNYDSTNVYIPELKSRGVTVYYSVLLSNDATLTSSIGIADNINEKITEVPYETSLTQMKNAITPAAGASFQIYQSDGVTTASELKDGYKVTVTAEDEVTKKTYTIEFDYLFIVSTQDYTLKIIRENNVCILEVDPSVYINWYNCNSHLVSGDAANLIYDYFEDNFDFIVFVNNERDFYTGAAYSGNYFDIKTDDVQGLNIRQKDDSAYYGSSGKLKGYIHFPQRIKLMHSGNHEFLHCWSAFLKLMVTENTYPHWGKIIDGNSTVSVINNAGGVHGGWQAGTLVQLGQNHYKAEGPEGISIFMPNDNGHVNNVKYSQIELYCMGLIGPTEVTQTFKVAENAQWVTDQEYEEFTCSQIKEYSIDDIIIENGNRVPGVSSSQKDFKTLVVLIDDSDISKSDYQNMSDYVKEYSITGDDGNTRLYNFYEATGGRATMKMDDLYNALKPSYR